MPFSTWAPTVRAVTYCRLLVYPAVVCDLVTLGDLSVLMSAEICASTRTVCDVEAGRGEARRASQNTMDDIASGSMHTCLQLHLSLQ